MKSCQTCLHKGVCKFLLGEMYRRYSEPVKVDFIKDIEKLEIELASKCKDYLGEVAHG